MSLDDLNLPKGNFFKFTCRDGHDTPNYTFSWELTPEGSAFLKKEKVRFPFMYVFAVEEIPPHKIESHGEGCGCRSCGGGVRKVEEQLFCLHEGSGMLQFHRQGTFRIYAIVIWYDDERSEQHTWRAHRSHALGRTDLYRDSITEGRGTPRWSLDQVVEDVVTITPTFFASKPNPILWWWANLWWENKPRNSCDYRKRIWFVLWLQLLTVPAYTVIRGVLMALSYLGLLLVGYRPSAFSFRPMFHAFSSIFKQLCDFESKTCNYAVRDSNGKERDIQSTLIRLPIAWVVVPAVLYGVGSSVYHHPMSWVFAVVTILGFIGAVAGWIFLSNKLRARRRSVEVYYEMVPVEKPKKQRVPAKARWIDAKGKLCLPYPE